MLVRFFVMRNQILRQAAAGEPSKSTQSRMRILDAAARVFRHKGYAATTLNEIAEAAEMKAGSLYYHFESKEQILEEVLNIGMQSVHDAVVASQSTLSPGATYEARIRAAVEAHLTTLLRHGDYTSANIRIFGQIPQAVQRRHLRLRDAYGAYWRGLLVEAQRAGALRDDIDLGLLRMLLLGALNWSVEWYKPRKKSISAIADHVFTLLFHGMGRRRQSTSRKGAVSENYARRGPS